MSRKEYYQPHELRAAQTAFDGAAQRLGLDFEPEHRKRRLSLAIAVLADYEAYPLATLLSDAVVRRLVANTSVYHAFA